ncbi:MAG: dUTP diphosphatase [Acidobacteria bacterium]|nr:dUTP diphosphatase [Acidobacteriota bacterium]
MTEHGPGASEFVVRYRWRGGCEDLAPPSYATAGAAGADLRAAVEDSLTLGPLERAVVPTGLFLEIPEGFEGQVRARSGLAARHGLALANGVGTIDSDYRGEVGVVMVNLGTAPVTLMRGDRIAQLVFARVERAVFETGADLAPSGRNAGGFGSTGSK